MRASTVTRGAAAPPATGLESTVGVYGYLCLYLKVLFFIALCAAAPRTFQALGREDYWVEYLTAAWFLLAGLVLFVTALAERRFRRCAYILGGMALMFVAGEEISWGQRIFGFATPDLLMRLNDQGELNIHNIANGLFDIIYLNGALILCMVTSAAFFCRKDELFGIPLPSIPLMLGFLMTLSYDTGINREIGIFSGVGFGEFITGLRRSFGLILVEEKGLLLLFFIFTLLSGQVRLAIASAATLALVLALTYVNFHSDVSTGSLYEVREYLFGVGCLFYCLELLLAQKRLAAISRTSIQRPSGPVSHDV